MSRKREQLLVAYADISVDASLTARSVREMVRRCGLRPAACLSDAVQLLEPTGTKVRPARVIFSYQAKGANTDDAERKLTAITGQRSHVGRIGVFHL